MSARSLQRTFRVMVVAGAVAGIMMIAGPANAFFFCFLNVEIIEGPRHRETIVADTVRYRLMLNRPPSFVGSLTCTLTGPTTASGCDPIVRDGWRQRSFSGMTFTGLREGTYLVTVTAVNRWGWVTDVDRRSFTVDLPDAAPCSVENPGSGATFGSDDGQALTDALAAAAPGDDLRVRGSCSGNYVLDRDVTLVGASTGAALDGLGSGTVLTVAADVAVEVRDLTITGGGDGGVINQGVLTLSGTTAVTDNHKSMTDPDFAFAFGGGILNDEGTLVLRDRSAVTDNSITASGSSEDIAFGGGIFTTGDVAISGNVTISGNTASTPDGGSAAGGGLYNEWAVVDVVGASVVSNTATSSGGTSADARGGGVYSVGSMTIRDTSITGNLATATATAGTFAAGGGIFKGDGQLDLDGATSVSSNTVSATGLQSQASGGGVYADNRDGALRLLGAVSMNGNVVSALNAVPAAAGGGLFTRGADAITVGWTGTVSRNTPDDCEPSQPLGGASCT